MTYEIEISSNAKCSFKRLNRQIAQRMYTKLKKISNSKDPFQYVKKLTDTTLFSLRVGDYRIILDIKRKKMIIFVLRVGHRRNIYKEL